MTIQREKWGEVDGKTVERLTLSNDNGVLARIINYGAALTELHVPDRDYHEVIVYRFATRG